MNAMYSLRIPDELLARIRKVSKEQGKTVSQFIKESLDYTLEYGRNRDIPTQIRDLEKRVGALEQCFEKLNQ